jgi:signal transduction histidine kinase
MSTADRLGPRVPRTIGAVLAFAGTAILLGWILHVPGLSKIHPFLSSMSSHSAFCFVLVGLGLMLMTSEDRRQRQAGWTAGLLIIVISLLTLSEWYHWGVGIHSVLVGPVGRLFPGRMPIATSIAFLSLGAALVLIDVEFAGWRPSEFLAFIAALTSLLALIAYTFSFVSFVPLPTRRPLALHTLIMLVACSFGVLAVRPTRGLMALATSDDAGGVMVRRLLPTAVLLPMLAGWLVMEAQRAKFVPPALSLAYYALSIVAIFGARIWFTAAALHRIDLRREEAETRARQLNAELEQRVAERTVQLETANKELEAFSYSVSHDLRAPLRAINGFSALLEKQCREEMSEKGSQYLANINDASHRMGQLIDDLLSLSRVTRNPMRRDHLDLTKMAADVVGRLRDSTPSRDIDAVIAAGLRANGDRNLIKIVLENLLGNAWKFTQKTAKPSIEVGMLMKDGARVYFVRDNGAGFDMAYGSKLFGAFQRLHSATDFEGTGIGLATVQRIVHRHGGHVWAEGAVGEGAVFYFTLGAHIDA